MDDGTSGKKRLLFVDDEAINLLCYKSLFRREYEVLTAASAPEGLHILEDGPVDAVISDQKMPEMKGTELFLKVQDHSRTGLRIILSGYSDDQDIRRALETGIIDLVLDKPLQERTLIRFIEGETSPSS